LGGGGGGGGGPPPPPPPPKKPNKKIQRYHSVNPRGRTHTHTHAHRKHRHMYAHIYTKDTHTHTHTKTRYIHIHTTHLRRAQVRVCVAHHKLDMIDSICHGDGKRATLSQVLQRKIHNKENDKTPMVSSTKTWGWKKEVP
jgi:hypothetical protein